MTFLILSVIVFIVITIMIKKKISMREMYVVSLFSIIIGFVVDIILDLKFHLYGYFEPGIQIASFLPIMVLFPTSGIIFINFYPFEKNSLKKTAYVMIATVVCLIYEYMAIKSGFFYYNGWTLWYSACVYPLLFFIQLLHFKVYKKMGSS